MEFHPKTECTLCGSNDDFESLVLNSKFNIIQHRQAKNIRILTSLGVCEPTAVVSDGSHCDQDI